MEKNGVRAHAIFHYRHTVDRNVKLRTGDHARYFRDSYLNQVAAYEMSRLLGITNVLPTVLRTVNRRKGSVQLWIENAFNERDRIEDNRLPPNLPMVELTAHDMRVFDSLINNIDRNQTNILFDPTWQLWYIDHTRAFGQEEELNRPEKLQRCSIPLWEKLQALDGDLLSETLDPYMGERQIRAVMTRRDMLVTYFQKKIVTEGEGTVLFHYPSR